MRRKIVAFISMIAVVMAMLPATVMAATLDKDFITSINFEVAGVAKGGFKPSSGEQLTIKLKYNTLGFAEQLLTATGTIKVKQGATTVKTFPAINSIASADQTVTWDGKDSDANFCSNPPGGACANGAYSLEVVVSSNVGPDMWTETLSQNFTIESAATVSITTFTATPTKGGATFDPAPSANDEDLTLTYALNQAANVEIDIRDSKDKVVKSFADTGKANGSFNWDGLIANKLAAPGTYKAVIRANKAGENAVTLSRDVVVAYNNAGKPGIDAYSLSPTSFDPDFEDTSILFTNLKDANITVEIRQNDGVVVRTFSDYSDDNFNAGDDHNIVWDGKNTSGTVLSDGGYKLAIELRNEFGVAIKEDTIQLVNTSGSVTSSNNHIDNISFSPSTRFKPSEDDELKIEFDAKVDLDELTISAVRGNERYEFYTQDELDSDDNIEATWDGKDDDDEYVAAGTWKIEFKSKVGSTNLTAAKSITIEYEKPNIDEFLISKTKFDNDLGEFTYAMFKVDRDAQITLSVLLSGDEDDTLEEEMDIEKDRWYAVQFDGSSYDYEDDIDLKLTAANLANSDVYDSEKIAVDLAEDDTSSSVSNVTNDYIDPVVTDGDQSMTLYYELEEEADVVVTIYKGKNTTGTKVIELLDEDNQSEGEHDISWNGKDEDGDNLSKGFYTYKIVSHKSSTDTEMGTFIVGDSQDLQEVGGGSSGSSTGGSSSGGSKPGVIIDGQVQGGGSSSTAKCAGFTDVLANSTYCEAITWAKESGVVRGYGDGTFKPFAAINRMEMLKVVLEAVGIGFDSSVSGTLGFSDVQVGAWYMGYIKAGKDRGIFSGDGGKATARPGDTVNRVEALKLAFESARFQTGFVIGSCSVNYSDVNSSDWFARYACQAYTYNLFDVGNMLEPGQLSTRGEVVEMLYRMSKNGIL